MDFFCELGAPSNLPFQSLPLLGASIKITASLRFLAVAAAASPQLPDRVPKNLSRIWEILL